jgi:hypothetical protein
MKSRISILFALGAVTACGAASSGDDGAAAGDDGSSDSTQSAPVSVDDGAGSATAALAECKAQRAVYLVGGNGGLASFTLAWPAPAVIKNFSTQYAYDQPAKALSVGSPAHPLFAREIGNQALWQGTGSAPQPSAFVAGSNETHTNMPQSIVVSPTAGGLMADGAVIQKPLAPVIPVMIFSPAGPYGTATGAPTPVMVSNVTAAVAAFNGKISAIQQAKLTPTSAQIASYFPAGATPSAVETTLATNLAFTANALKLGLIGSVVLPAFNDDPHQLFQSGGATARADDLASILNTFYTDLGTVNESSCGHAGKAISLADNTVMVVDGDTPKNSFNNAGWPDGTPGSANLLYVRSNGFTIPGWFGDLEPTTRTNFDPNTGLPSAGTTNADSTAAAFAGTLYAIARGSQAKVATFTSAPYAGVLAQ